MQISVVWKSTARALREEPVGSRASHEAAQAAPCFFLRRPFTTLRREVVDMEKEKEKKNIVHEYASFMLTDMELKQKGGTASRIDYGNRERERESERVFLEWRSRGSTPVTRRYAFFSRHFFATWFSNGMCIECRK